MSDSEDDYPIKPNRKPQNRPKINEDSEFEELENIINADANKRRDDDELDEEDLYLIRENSKLINKKRKRVRMLDSDSDNELIQQKTSVHRIKTNTHAQNISFNQTRNVTRNTEDYRSFSEISDDELDDFIVDDYNNEENIQKRDHPKINEDDTETNVIKSKPKRISRAVAEQNELFGADFQYDEIEALIAHDRYDKTEKSTNLSFLDPADIAHSHLTTEDLNLCLKDIPERFLTRSAQVKPCADAELEQESRWIFEHAFKNTQTFINNSVKQNLFYINIIKIILNAMRNLGHDIPFIINYRKELYHSYFSDDDIWIIYDYDCDWMHLLDHKNKITNLITQMINYQQFITKNNLINEIDIGKVINITEINKVAEIYDMAILRDYHNYFSFIHMPKLLKLHKYLENKLETAQFKDLKIIDINEQKLPAQFDFIDYLIKFRFNLFFNEIGITTDEFAQNLLLNFPKFIPRNTKSPENTAHDYINAVYNDAQKILKHATKLWADDLAHNTIINSEARRFFFANAKVTCAPTQLGLRQIDSLHPYSDFKYLLDKPIEAFTSEQFLQLNIAQSQGLISVKISVYDVNHKTFIDYCRPFLESEENSGVISGNFNQNIQNNNILSNNFHNSNINTYNSTDNNKILTWNDFRINALKIAYDSHLFPKLQKEFNDTLMLEAQKHVTNYSSRLLKNHLSFSADSRKLDSTYVFSIVLPPFTNPSASKPQNINDGICAVVASDGSLIETFILDSALLIATHTPSEYSKKRIRLSIQLLIEKITYFKPVSIVFPLEAKNIIILSQYIEKELSESSLEEKPAIEVVNNLFPNLAAKSHTYKKEMPKASFIEKHAISAARFSIDPLLEIAQLFEYQDDIISVFNNQYSKCISKEFLFQRYQRVLIDIVNSIGVDINRCVTDYRYSNLLKYISGFGPSKASYLLMKLRKINAKIRSRASLIADHEVGPIVFENCAGFIRIIADIEIDEDVEPFDTTRIHPESYDFAKEILAVVFEAQNTSEINCVEMMLELLVKPNLLHSLDYNTVKSRVKLLKSDLSLTMDDIKAEFASPYEDKRAHYKPLSEEGIFWVLGTKGVYFDREFMKDPFNPLAIGNSISGTVISYTSSKPSQNKIRDMIYREDSGNQAGGGNFICPFCRDYSADKLNLVLEHCEKFCPGLIVGVRVKLENDLIGFIPRENIITDKKDNIKEKLEIGMVVNARIVNVNEKKFSVELTYKANEAFTFKVGEKGRDKYYDYIAEKMDIFKAQEKKEKLSNRVVYHKKLVLHPLFKNLTFNEAEKYMKQKPDCDCVIRPSSRGIDRLTATIRIVDDIILHLEIREEEKASDFTLGKKLWIQNRMFEDLDEIYAVYITPMLNNFADATKNKAYFFANDSETTLIFNELKNRLETTPKSVPFLISISRSHPGKLFIAYLQKNGVQFQYITVTPDGFKIKEITHPTVETLITWFKGRITERQNAPPKSTTYTPRYDEPLPQMPKYPQGVRNTPSVYQTANPVHAWQQR